MDHSSAEALERVRSESVDAYSRSAWRLRRKQRAYFGYAWLPVTTAFAAYLVGTTAIDWDWNVRVGIGVAQVVPAVLMVASASWVRAHCARTAADDHAPELV
jgi:hypothetical protein